MEFVNFTLQFVPVLIVKHESTTDNLWLNIKYEEIKIREVQMLPLKIKPQDIQFTKNSLIKGGGQ